MQLLLSAYFLLRITFVKCLVFLTPEELIDPSQVCGKPNAGQKGEKLVISSLGLIENPKVAFETKIKLNTTSSVHCAKFIAVDSTTWD